MNSIKKHRRSFSAIALVLAMMILFSSFPVSAATTTTTTKKLKLSATKVSMAVGMTYTLKLKGLDNQKKAKWISSKKGVATVDKFGIVKAVAPGKTAITAKYKGKTYKCIVTVYENYVKLDTSKQPWKYTLNNNICYQFNEMSFDKDGNLKVKIQFYDDSAIYKYTIYSFSLKIRGTNGKPFVNKWLKLSNPFEIRSKKYYTLTLTVNRNDVKNVVDLTKIDSAKFNGLVTIN
jgi:hypothetical protein